MDSRTKDLLRHMLDLGDDQAIPAGYVECWERISHYRRRLGLTNASVDLLPMMVAMMERAPAPSFTVDTLDDTPTKVVAVPKPKKGNYTQVIKGSAPGPKLTKEQWDKVEHGAEVAWFCYGGWKHGTFEGVNDERTIFATADGKTKPRKINVVRLVQPSGVKNNV